MLYCFSECKSFGTHIDLLVNKRSAFMYKTFDFVALSTYQCGLLVPASDKLESELANIIMLTRMQFC